jgi:hypothetical protein
VTSAPKSAAAAYFSLRPDIAVLPPKIVVTVIWRLGLQSDNRGRRPGPPDRLFARSFQRNHTRRAGGGAIEIEKTLLERLSLYCAVQALGDRRTLPCDQGTPNAIKVSRRASGPAAAGTLGKVGPHQKFGRCHFKPALNWLMCCAFSIPNDAGKLTMPGRTVPLMATVRLPKSR